MSPYAQLLIARVCLPRLAGWHFFRKVWCAVDRKFPTFLVVSAGFVYRCATGLPSLLVVKSAAHV